MRLRITVRRHGLPDIPIMWSIDSESSTIAQLLEQVNEIVPIESEDWGVEDYAVELKGSNGVDFECLHFQPVGKVMKEDDEVIIRPLLTRDLKMRKISGRHQISADGKHLVDGLPFGRPLLRRPAERPAVKIPPRKRPRLTYNEDENDGGSFLGLPKNEVLEFGESGDDDGNRKLVLHADFEDDDSEDDEDFVPGKDYEQDGETDGETDEELDEEFDQGADDAEVDEEMLEERKAEEQLAVNNQATDNEYNLDESDLNDVPYAGIRTKIRKLHSAFPASPLAVCKYVLDGTGGDVGAAYRTMSLGFQPVRPASAIAEISEARLSDTIRSRKRKAPAEQADAPNSMQVEATQIEDSVLLGRYDRNGLPPGSITSGNALSHMAEAVQSFSGRRPNSRRSHSALSEKSVRFSLNEGLANGSTSTPAIDQDSAHDSDEGSDSTSSDETSHSGTSSSGEDSSSSDESKEDAEALDTSSSPSDSDSSSGLSSEDDAPEETSSKITATKKPDPEPVSTKKPSPRPEKQSSVPPGGGSRRTRTRNERRRLANAMRRFKQKGILPAGITLAEFSQLSDVNSNTSAEDALAALEAVRARMKPVEVDKKISKLSDNSEEFKARRQALLASLEAGGIEVDSVQSDVFSRRASRDTSTQAQESVTRSKSTPLVHLSDGVNNVSKAFSNAQENPQLAPSNSASQTHTQETPQSSLKAASATDASQNFAGLSVELNSPVLANVSTVEATAPNPVSEPASTSATPSRRTKLDLGAGRRMLFGALGLKVPKSKKDEEKVRNELMKGARPILTQKPAEESTEENDDIEDQDPEAWRDKITYRAVECCHNGIELSEPPFPFAQRWDPQQQGGWLHGKNSGKSKKNQRDESHHYQDVGPPSKKQKQRKGKHRNAEQQEYLDASYQPSPKNRSFLEFDDTAQQKKLSSDDMVDKQLMNDLNGEASAEVSQRPEDLAALPEDPKTLLDLLDGQAKPGMTIAFKELTMSEETKWQPEISNYRTAVVNAVLDEGGLQITLALRDRIITEKFYDAETGERIYGRFQMPDQDDDSEEEDDGIRNIAFTDLIEPKIVQGAPEGLDVENSRPDEPMLLTRTDRDAQTLSHEHEDNVAEAQLSHVTETPLSSDAPESQPQELFGQPMAKPPESDAQEDEEMNEGSAISTFQKPIQDTLEHRVMRIASDELSNASQGQENGVLAVDASEAKEIADENSTNKLVVAEEQDETSPIADWEISIESISTDAKVKISEMIREAGFRSSVPSSVLKDVRPNGVESPGDAHIFEKLMKDMNEIESNPSYSPKFHGLDASSPIKKLRPTLPDRQISSSPGRPPSSWQTTDTDAASDPTQHEESSWFTMEPEDSSSPPANLPTKSVAWSKRAELSKLPLMARAQEIWEAIQPKSSRTSVNSSMALPEPPTGLGGTEEKDSNTSIRYPKLSITSSFTSQVSDHGRQPDINFDDSAMTNGDASKVTAFEDDIFSNPADDLISDVEQELLSHKSGGANDQRQPPDASSSNDERSTDDSNDDEDDETSSNEGDGSEPSQDEKLVKEENEVDEEPQPRLNSTINESAKSQSKTHDVLQGSPTSDDVFPTMHAILSQRSVGRDKNTPVRSKAAKSIKSSQDKKKVHRGDEFSDDEDITPKASQKNGRAIKYEPFLATSQTRNSTRQPKFRGSQPQATHNGPSQSQSQFTSTQQSVVVDLTLISSDVEGRSEDDAVLSDVEEKPRRFRRYALDKDDDDEFIAEEAGWVKKSSSQQPLATSRQSRTKGLTPSSQSSLNTSKRKTTARF